MATLYFNGAVDGEWTELGNWWTDDAFTTQATSLPTSFDNVIVGNNLNTYVVISSNSGSEPTVANLTLNVTGIYTNITVTGKVTFNGCENGVPGTPYGSHFTNTMTVGGDVDFNDCSYAQGTLNCIGVVTFNQNAYNAGFISDATFNDSSYNNSTVSGNATFNDNSVNYGTVSGNATYNGLTGVSNNTYFIGGQGTTLDSSGNGSWNGSYYISGTQTTLDSNGNGFNQNDGYYYISGTQTTLDSNGNGFNQNDGYYYISGTQTTLDSNGTGSWNGSYYINSQNTSLDENGSGCWNGTSYTYGLTLLEANFTGYDNYCDSGYYINGLLSGLDSYGSGCYLDLGVVYYNGAPGMDPSFSGYSYCDDKYYVFGQQTTLDSNGTGTWNGVEYLNGVAARTLYYNASTDTNWDTLTNWWNNQNCTEQAVSLPTSIDSVVIITEAAVLSGNPSSIKNLTVL
jgi:hypothetical protein